MSSLAIYAGPSAFQRIIEEGFDSKHFNVMVGASGGPKWFVLFGLDRYLFGNFFADRNEPLHTIGSSVGAWRMCCLAAKDPVSCVERLAHYYCHEDYSGMSSVKEITLSARIMLDKILTGDVRKEIVNNKKFRTHIVTTRSRGVSSSASDLLHSFHLGSSALCNFFTRNSLGWFFDRALFTNEVEMSQWANSPKISTLSALTEENLIEALLASGSIPYVLEGVNDIAGSEPGRYWDGGIMDYHFDWPFCNTDSDLVLYPHYTPQLIPGWFDKLIPWRKVDDSHLDKVVLLTPTTEFVENLPGGKIPDRNDFKHLSFDRRVKVWEEVMKKSESLALELNTLIESDEVAGAIRPIQERMR